MALDILKSLIRTNHQGQCFGIIIFELNSVIGNAQILGIRGKFLKDCIGLNQAKPNIAKAPTFLKAQKCLRKFPPAGRSFLYTRKCFFAGVN
jgi:hypothetical protein